MRRPGATADGDRRASRPGARSARTCANGATVIAQHTATHRAVTIHASVAAGSGHDADSALGTANFVAKVIDRGTAVALDRRAGRGVRRPRRLAVGERLAAPDDVHAARAWPTTSRRCSPWSPASSRRPTFPADQVELRRSSVITSIRQDEDNPAVVATEALMAALYPGGHPYGRRAKGTVASIQAIGRDALVAFHRAHVGASTLRVVIVGRRGRRQGGGACRDRLRRLDARRRRAAGAAACDAGAHQDRADDRDAGQGAKRHRVRFHVGHPAPTRGTTR